MQRILIAILFISLSTYGQVERKSFKAGEWLKFRVHYGLISAGYATLEVNPSDNPNELALNGKGWAVGMFDLFFKVNDNYQSRIDVRTGLPTMAFRNVYEGGYKINREIKFKRATNQVKVKDKKKDVRADSTYVVTEKTVDMLSAFYFAREFETDTLIAGHSYALDIFMDYSIFNFKILYLGKETIETKFGMVECLKFKPRLESGRVFKEDEGVTLWISNDQNKIPIRFKSKLRVGSISVDLEEFKGLKHSFRIFHKQN